MRFWLFLLLIACAGLGCSPQIVPVPLPVPPIEQPVANLPAPLHQRNWSGPKGQGSCVHASVVNHLLWLNANEMAAWWRRTFGDGEYDSRLMQRLDAAGLDYAFTQNADPRFLDWATMTRRGAVLWWKPSHCCTFLGWVNREGRQYAAILDNNYPGRIEYTPREQFIRLWAGYGGYAVTILLPPASGLTYPSYRLQT